MSALTVVVLVATVSVWPVGLLIAHLRPWREPDDHPKGGTS